MRIIGIVLLIIGALLLLIAISIDTSVSTGMGGRVHNLGLLSQQQMLLMLGGFTAVVGAIFVAAPAIGNVGRESSISATEAHAGPILGMSISRAWDETKAAITADGRLMVVVAAALIALPMLIMGVLSPRTEGTQPSLVSALILLCSSLLAIVGQLAIIRLAIGSNVSVGEAIGHGAKRMPIYFVAGILIVLALVLVLIPLTVILYASGVPLEEAAIAASPLALILMLVFIAFAFFIGVRMLMSSPVASEEAIGPVSILRRSWDLTSGHFLRLFGFILLFVIGAGIALMAINWAVTIVAVLMLGPVEPMSASALIVAVVDAIVNAAVSLLLAVMLARIYLQLAGREAIDVTVPKSGT